MVFDFERYLAHVRWILRPEDMLSEQFVSWYPESIWMAHGAEGIIQRIGVLLDAQVRFLGPALIACAVVALIETARRQRAKLWLAFPALSYLVTFLMAINHFQLRYAMPVTQQPEFVSVIPDWSSVPGSAHSRAYPRELFEQLDGGSLGYALAAQFDSGFWSARPLLDYPAVSPPVRIYRRIGSVRRGCCRKEPTGPSSN
jgi:hypothetical protein